jgi:uncharacterized protein (TIRG00374 family)
MAGDRRRARELLGAAGASAIVVLAVLFVVGNRGEVPAAWRELRSARPQWLGVAFALSLLGLLDLGFQHVATQRAAGVHVAPGRAVRLAAAGHFLNVVTKSGGMAGVAPFLADARRCGRPRGPTLAGYVLSTVLGDLSFAVTLGVAMVIVALDGKLSSNELIASAAFTVLLVARVGMVAAAFRSRSAVRRLHALPRRLVARFVRRDRTVRPDDHAADELYDAVAMLRRHPGAAAPGFVLALGIEALGVAMLLAVLAAVHAPHGIAVGVVAYAISVLFAIVGFLPGGLGFVEVSLGAVLVSFGSSVAEATAAVALYRLGELWIPASIGAVAAHRERAR